MPKKICNIVDNHFFRTESSQYLLTFHHNIYLLVFHSGSSFHASVPACMQMGGGSREIFSHAVTSWMSDGHKVGEGWVGGDNQSIPSYGGSQASPSLLVALQVWLVDCVLVHCQQMASLLVDLCTKRHHTVIKHPTLSTVNSLRRQALLG